mgnify:CR=1
MKCPYCNKTFDIPEILYEYVGAYDSSSSDIKCKKCHKMCSIYAVRTVRIKDISKSNAKDESW